MWRRSHPFFAPGGGSSMLAQQAALLLLPVLLFFMLALVVGLSPTGDGELNLRASPRVEINGERDERHALPHHRAEHLVHLLGVEEQFARPLGLMVEAVAVAEFGNVGVDQPDLAVLHLR